MIDFEEELKKFRPSLEIEETGELVREQELTDMSDVLVKILKDVENGTFRRN